MIGPFADRDKTYPYAVRWRQYVSLQTRRQAGARAADVFGLTALAAFLLCVIQPYGIPDPLGLGPGSSWTAICYTFAISVLLTRLVRPVRLPLTPFDYLLFVYVAVVLVTWPTASDRQVGLEAIRALLGQIGVFYAARLLLADSRLPGDLIVTVLVAGSAVLQLIAIGSHAEHGLFARLAEYSSPSAWGGRPELAIVAAIEFALLLGIRWRSRPRTFQLAFLCLVFTIVVELIFLYSRLAWIGVCVALFACGCVTIRTVGARWYAIALACVAVLAVPLLVRDPSLTRVMESMVGPNQVGPPEMRYALWRRSARMIRDHPLLGVGLGNSQAAYVPYYRPEDANDDNRPGVHPHNLFLHQAGEVGIPGGLIYAALWSVGLFAGWKEETGRFSAHRPPAGALYALIAIVVMNLGENIFLDAVAVPRARVHSVAWILLALTIAEWSRRRIPRAESSSSGAAA